MATTAKTFSVRNGIDVANTIIALNTSGVINVSNIQLMNVVNLNVSANISNTGNLLVTQNTFTGNITVTTQANTSLLNVATTANVATLNVLGVLTVNASPCINLSTRAMTGLTCNLTANAQTNSNTAQTNLFSCTFNEVGMYQIEAFIIYGLHTTSTNAGFAGMNIAWGNSGTATVATVKYAATGKANSNTIISNLVTGVAQSTIIPNTTSIANSTNNSDYLLISGYLNVSAVGTVNIQFASANSINANVNVSANSYVVYTKIG